MSESNGRIIHRHRRRSDDGKGVRRLIAGRRFRTPAGVSPREAEHRFSKIEALWRDNEKICRNIGRPVEWTHIAVWAAERLRKGDVRVSLPPIDDTLASYGECEYPSTLNQIVWQHTDDTLACHCPPTVDGLEWDEAKHFYDVVSNAFSSVNWLLPSPHANSIVDFHQTQARHSLKELAKAKNQSPPDPATPLCPGTFHEALEAFEEDRRMDFTLLDGTFDNSGHHMLGMIRTMRERINDFPLAELDFTKCQYVVDFWRNRPQSLSGEMPLSHKTCGDYLGELKRFYEWLHLTSTFGWRKPEDFGSLKYRICTLPSDRRSLDELEIQRYWGTWDLLGGGLLVTMAKHSRIDTARKHAHTAQRHLRSFQKELADADERLGVSLDIGVFVTFADYFFDGLIADWIMQSKIENASSACSSAISQVSAVLGECHRRLTEVERAREGVKIARREFLEKG